MTPEPSPADHSLGWVVLTRGDRPDELKRAIASIRRTAAGAPIVVVVNGTPAAAAALDPDVELDGKIDIVALPENVGVPAGRDLGVRRLDTDIVAFLDDDAELLEVDAGQRIVDAFTDPGVAAVTLRIEDESGRVQRRHVPRIGRRSADRPGSVVNFLGGASAVRRQAYHRAGGYWGDLFYAHEELDLAWRLHDDGGSVTYLPDVVVRHPRTPIGRHPDGWRLTGRNRVMIARRNLPWLIAVVHVTAWLMLGLLRAPDTSCRGAYVAGWRHGWHVPTDRRPIAWRTVIRLTRLGRPPVI